MYEYVLVTQSLVFPATFRKFLFEKKKKDSANFQTWSNTYENDLTTRRKLEKYFKYRLSGWSLNSHFEISIEIFMSKLAENIFWSNRYHACNALECSKAPWKFL